MIHVRTFLGNATLNNFNMLICARAALGKIYRYFTEQLVDADQTTGTCWGFACSIFICHPRKIISHLVAIHSTIDFAEFCSHSLIQGLSMSVFRIYDLRKVSKQANTP